MKFYLFVLVFFYFQILAGQIDSVKIDTISIVGNITNTAGFNYSESSVTYRNLQEAIFMKSGAYARNYAPGQSSTIQILGASSSQSNVIWKNINIGNPMLGLMDLSILPVQFFEESFINYFPDQKNQAIGSNINLESKLLKSDNIKLAYNYSSLGNHEIYGCINKVFKDQIHNIQLFNLQAENRYKLDVGPFIYEMNYAQQKSFHIKYDGTLKVNKWILNPSIWIGNMNRNVPSTFGGNANNERQEDQNIRFQMGAKKISNLFSFEQNVGYIKDEIYFKNNFLDDRGIATSFHSNSDFSFHFKKSITFNSFFKLTHFTGSHPNYTEPKARILALNWSNFLKYNFKKFDFSFSTNLQKNSQQSSKISVNPSAEILYHSRAAKFVFQFQKATRFPTLNDLNWTPGGNQNLQPETANKLAFTIQKLMHKSTINFLLFNRFATNQIQWIPTSSFYSPINVGKVHAYGGNFTWNYKNQLSKTWNFSSNQSYFYTKSINKTENTSQFNKQLIYVPIHKFNHSLQLTRENYGLFLDQQWSSLRYTNLDNSSYLNAFYLLDVKLFYNILLSNKLRLNLNVAVKNISNSIFQHQAGFFQPGRQLEMGLQFNY